MFIIIWSTHPFGLGFINVRSESSVVYFKNGTEGEEDAETIAEDQALSPVGSHLEQKWIGSYFYQHKTFSWPIRI